MHAAERLPRAVLYLRVSTKEQAERDGDPEGYSIPAQREACKRKATSLGAVVVEEFVDRGESARSANRPELQRMLEELQPVRCDIVQWSFMGLSLAGLNLIASIALMGYSLWALRGGRRR